MIYIEPMLDHLIERAVEARAQSDSNEPAIEVHAVVNGRLVSSMQCAKRSFVFIASRSVSLLGKSSLRQNLVQIDSNIKYSLEKAIAAAIERGVLDANDLPDGIQDYNYETAWIDYREKLPRGAEFGGEKMARLYQHGKDWYDHDMWCDGIPRTTVRPDQSEKCLIPYVGKPGCDR